MVNLLKNQQFNKLHFLVGKWTELCEKLQKSEGGGFGIQLEVGEWGTEISEVLRPDAAWHYMQGRIACVRIRTHIARVHPVGLSYHGSRRHVSMCPLD